MLSKARGAFGPALVAIVTLALGLPALTWPANTLDEMILLVYPLRMMEGDLPYRDFFAAYGPAHWWLLEGLYRLFAPTIAVERAFGLVVHVALTLGLFAICRPAGRLPAVLSGLLGAVLVFRLGDAPYAWLLATALILWQLARLCGTPARAGTTVLAGALAGLAVSVRPDVLLLAVVPALPLLRGTGRARHWLAGFAVGLLPLMVGFALAPTDLVRDILLGRAGRGAGQSRLPLPPIDSADQVFLGVLALAVLLTLVAAIASSQPQLRSFALLGALAMPQALQRADQVHFVYAGLLCLPVLPLVVGQLLRHLPFPSRRPHVLGALIGLSLFLVGTAQGVLQPLLLTLAGDGPEAVLVTHRGRTVPELPARASALHELLPRLETVTRPGERVFVFDTDVTRPMITDVGLYFLLPHLRGRGVNLEITPGVSNTDGSGLAQDLHEADVLVLVTAPTAFRQALFPYARDGSLTASRVLADEFCQVLEVDYYLVYRRCR